MILTILIIFFCLFCFFLAVGAIWFALRVVGIAIDKAKPNTINTININQLDKKPELNVVSEILRTINLLLTTKVVLQIEKKEKDND